MRQKYPPYFDESIYPGNYEESLLEMIESAIDDWEEKHAGVWDFDTYQCLDELCGALMSASSAPMESESIFKLLVKYLIQLKSNEDYVEDYDDLELQYNDVPEFEELIESELAKESLAMIASGITRLKDLMFILILIQKVTVPEIPLNYLKRVFRCYIWGLDPECVILCRSVIETAINDKLSDKFWQKHCNYGEGYTLKNKITALKEAALFRKI